MTSKPIDWEDYQKLSDGTRWDAYEKQLREIERLRKVEAWYIRVRQMIGDWYVQRIGKPMTSHEADAITVMGARWRKDRAEVARLKAEVERLRQEDKWPGELAAALVAHVDSPAVCFVCGVPATCIGWCMDAGVAAMCDEHCGHGNEDSTCYSVLPTRAEVERLRLIIADVEALTERADQQQDLEEALALLEDIARRLLDADVPEEGG